MNKDTATAAAAAAAHKQADKLLDLASGLTDLAGKLADISINISEVAERGGSGFLEQQKNLDHFRKEFSQFTKNNSAYLTSVKKRTAVGKPVQRKTSNIKHRQQSDEGSFVPTKKKDRGTNFGNKKAKKKSVSK